MNPNIDLSSFSRSASAAPYNAAPLGRPLTLVGPPRRLFTRYVVPAMLLAGFGALALYAGRGAWQRPLAVVVTSPVVIGTGGAGGASTASVQAVSGSAQGTTASAQSAAPARPLFQAPGWVEPSPLPITITALTAGNVAHVHVLEGQPVSSGTLVAELVDDEHEIDEREAQSMLALKKAQLEAAQSDWDNPTALKEALRTAQAEAVRLIAEKTKVQTALELAQKEAEAGRSLSKGGYEAGLATYRQQSEERTQKSSIAEIDAKIALNQVALQAAEERLRLRIADKEKLETAKAEVKNAEAKLAQAKLKHDRCHIIAPSDGVIMQLFVRPGSMISPDVEGGMQVATMYDPKNIQVRAEIPLAETHKVQIGLTAEVRVDAVPDRVYHGELVRIVPQADVQKNVLPVKVKISDPDGRVRPDMIAKVQFMNATAPASPPGKAVAVAPSKSDAVVPASTSAAAGTGGLYVPEAAISSVQGSDATVWTATAGGVAEPRKVKVGDKLGDLRAIAEGLQPPDRIIISQLDRLKPGMRISIQEEK
jgi:multidrug efflux pump subunit AcrA (membrane-fusion protein)